MSIPRLPLELFTLIVKEVAIPRPYHDREYFIDAESLCNIRLSCSQLCHMATPILFRTIRLMPTENSIERWNHVLADESLLTLVREVRVHAPFYANDIFFGDWEWENFEYKDDWEAAVARISEFPKVDSVQIRFPPVCAYARDGAERFWVLQAIYDVEDHSERRVKFLQFLFEIIDGFNSQEGRRISSLSMENFSGVANYTELDQSASFFHVLKRLDELHVHVSTSCDNKVEPWRQCGLYWFLERFTTQWLQPASANLKALTLYCDTYWGVIPAWLTSDLYFPKLKSLCLGNYTLASERQVDWITKHKALEHISFEDTVIAHHFKIDNTKDWPNEFIDPAIAAANLLEDTVGRVDNAGNQCRYFDSALRWHMVFDKLRSELPNLKDFRTSPDREEVLEEVHTRAGRFVLERYVAFSCSRDFLYWAKPRPSLRHERGDKDSPWLSYEKFKVFGYTPSLELPSNDESIDRRDKEAYYRLLWSLASRRDL